MGICKREGVTPADKVNDWIDEYNKIHASGNPQYTMQQFIQNEDFKAVPAMLESNPRWLQFLEHASIDELEEIEQKADFLRKAAKGSKNVKVREATKLLRKRTEASRLPALPETSDTAAARRANLRQYFAELGRPTHDRKGGEAHRARRNVVIQAILRLQEMLPEYQTCQEYLEWLERQR